MSKKSYVPLNLLSQAGHPAVAEVGDLYFDTTSGLVQVYTGVNWQPVTDDLNSLINGGSPASTQVSVIDGGVPGSTF